uniref:Ig-like domain-containing protein n=1 Tax=Erpetoichthys calabaricus TaxID=27687 RepID=A0A8C4S1C6_ERPCA
MTRTRVKHTSCTLCITWQLGAEPFATIAPPVHTHESGNVKTLLVCVIGDFLHDDFEVTWTTNGIDDSLDYITYSITKEEDGTHSTLSLLSVSSYELDLYSCIVRHRSTDGLAQGPNRAESLLAFTGFEPATFQLPVQIPSLRE